MGWNLEVACLRGEKARLNNVVPRVFDATKKTVGFEDATSSSRPPSLCAGKVGDWFVALDAACRLSERADYLAKASAPGELYVVRIADAPLELLYKSGKKARLKPPTAQEGDGEQRAMAWLEQRTGLSFVNDLWSVRYTVFKLDL